MNVPQWAMTLIARMHSARQVDQQRAEPHRSLPLSSVEPFASRPTTLDADIHYGRALNLPLLESRLPAYTCPAEEQVLKCRQTRVASIKSLAGRSRMCRFKSLRANARAIKKRNENSIWCVDTCAFVGLRNVAEDSTFHSWRVIMQSVGRYE